MASPTAARMACVIRWSGMRTPTVCFLGLRVMRGTSFVPFKMNVYGPGVRDLMSLNSEFPTMTSWPSCAKSWHRRVKWWRSPTCRIARIRSRPSLLAREQPIAYPESVGKAITSPFLTCSATLSTSRCCGSTGWIST